MRDQPRSLRWWLVWGIPAWCWLAALAWLASVLAQQLGDLPLSEVLFWVVRGAWAALGVDSLLLLWLLGQGALPEDGAAVGTDPAAP